MNSATYKYVLNAKPSALKYLLPRRRKILEMIISDSEFHENLAETIYSYEGSDDEDLRQEWICKYKNQDKKI